MPKQDITIKKLRKIRASRKSLVRKLDELVSQIVRLRDKKCIVCGTTKDLTCGHVFSRSAYSTRWDLSNCYAQCWPHNFSHEFDPYPMINVIIALKGNEFLAELHRIYKTPVILKDFQLEEMVEQFKVILKDLQRKAN